MITLFGAVPGLGDSRLEQQLNGLPRPRIVSIAWRDRIILFFVFSFLVLWMIAWTRAMLESWKRQPGWGALAVLLLPIYASLWVYELRRELRNRPILANGEFALGAVTSQQDIGGRTRRSKIAYEFRDTQGRIWRGKGYDFTKAYAENMAILVFYEPNDPSQNVALCATIWRLRSKHGELISPS
jgi:hypothetical protein